jgi:iron complex transport system substrate-binding protein
VTYRRLGGLLLAIGGTALLLGLVWQLRQFGPGPVPQGARLQGEGFPKTLIDQSGRQVLLPHKPQRIASVTLATDEILLALVEPSRLIGVTYLAIDEQVSNVPHLAAMVPHTLHADAEQVIALQPDLVFVASYLRPEVVKILQDTGLPVFQFQEFESIAAIQGNIRLVAQAVGEEVRGEELVAQMNSRLQAVAARLVDIKARPRVLYWESWGLTGGAHTSIDDLITYAGGENLAATLGLTGIVTLSAEQVLAMNPEVIFTGGKSGETADGLPSFLRHPALQVVEAVRHGRAYVLPRRHLVTISHHIIDGVEALARAMHPQMAKLEVSP